MRYSLSRYKQLALIHVPFSNPLYLQIVQSSCWISSRYFGFCQMFPALGVASASSTTTCAKPSVLPSLEACLHDFFTTEARRHREERREKSFGKSVIPANTSASHICQKFIFWRTRKRRHGNNLRRFPYAPFLFSLQAQTFRKCGQNSDFGQIFWTSPPCLRASVVNFFFAFFHRTFGPIVTGFLNIRGPSAVNFF